jgi:5-methylcytosine-specific restriction endonuclease McrA
MSRRSTLTDEEKKAHRKAQRKAYYEANIDRIRKKDRERHDANRDERNKASREYYAANREKLLEQNREYREQNRDRLAKCDRLRYESNAAQRKEYARKHRQANIDKCREQCRRNYAANRSLRREYAQRRHEANPEIRQQANQQGRRIRRARERNAIDPAAPAATAAATARRVWLFGNACAYCGSDGPLHLDHVEPLARGGLHTPDNLVPACQRCNLSKNAKPVEAWYLSQPFFSPDRWETLQAHTGRRWSAAEQLSLMDLLSA